MLNRTELQKRYGTQDCFLEQFVPLFATRLLLSSCIVEAGYMPTAPFIQEIALSSSGKDLLEKLVEIPECSNESYAKLAIFLQFYSEELYVDCSQSGTQAMLECLENEISQRKIRYPWVFDRELYDRYADIVAISKSELTYEETIRVINGTSSGVFQLADLVVGPLGILRSAARRALLPSRSVALWHCSDSACRTLHPTELGTGATPILPYMQAIENISQAEHRRESDWFELFIDHARDCDWYDDRNASTLPWLIANAFVTEELQCIALELLQTEVGKAMRSQLASHATDKGRFAVAAKELTAMLTKSECFQFILLAHDNDIIVATEEAIRSGAINIPHTEIRAHRYSRGASSALRVRCQCSHLGIRFVAGDNLATNRMRGLLKHLYLPDCAEELKWKLRHIPATSVERKIETYLQVENPKAVIEQLCFADEEKATQTLAYVGRLPPNLKEWEGKEDVLIETLLWKVGFDFPQYPEYELQFWSRFAAFREVAQTNLPYSDGDMDRIRSKAVNFFVSLEELLDLSISFSTWMLLSDHAHETNCRFELSTAREFMSTLLNGRNRGNGDIAIQGRRQNTLYPMTQAFALLADLCEEWLANGHVQKRAVEQLPGFLRSSRVWVFPFQSNVFLGDVTADELTAYLAALRDITRTLESFKVCEIRNRLEHMRDDFPSQQEIENTCEGLESVARILDDAGVCPSVYCRVSKFTDEFDRSKVTMANGRGRRLDISLPSQFEGIRVPSLAQPQIIVPSIHLGHSLEPVRFYFEEKSPYSDRWLNYPVRIARSDSAEGEKDATELSCDSTDATVALER